MISVWGVVQLSLEEVFALSKRRITFSKLGMGKYISHLDLLRCFTRTIQRSGLPVVYSQGFNPHQKITFSLPLPIGVTSGCETVDIMFEDTVSDKEIMEKLNENLPMDMRVLSVGEPQIKASEIVAAEYTMKAVTDDEIQENTIKKFFGQEEIIVMKKTKKKGEKPVNLLDFIRAYEIIEKNTLRVVVDAGGERNLKPEILGKSISDFIDGIDDWDIHREKIFYKDNKGLLKEFK